MHLRTTALLVFVVITLLTALAVLGAAVGWLPDADDRLLKWGIPAVLGEIVGTTVLYVRAPMTRALLVNLDFSRATKKAVNLAGTGTYIIRDSSGKTKRKGTVVPIHVDGGWKVQLPGSMAANDSVTLTFTTLEGDRWEVWPFLPYVLTKEAILVGYAQQTTAQASVDEEAASAMRSSLRDLAAAQEAYFADYLTYADGISRLAYQSWPGVVVTLKFASDAGWAAIATHKDTHITCGLWYGDIPTSARTGEQEGVPDCH
jgi:hypothetical protein